LGDNLNSKGENVDRLRGKVRQLYAFLKEANQIQFRPVRRLVDQQYVVRISEMPRHPSAQLFRPVRIENSLEVPDVLLRISRPKLTRCPSSPNSCSEWLLPNWDDPHLEAEVAESKNIVEIHENEEGQDVEVTVMILFTDDQLRADQFRQWMEERRKWSEPEIIARGAMKFFENFYGLYSRLEKEGEKLELLVGDGFLSWQAESGIDGNVVIQHPILLKRVELRFNAYVPEFTVHETDREVELYSNLFLDLKDVESVSIRNRKTELEASQYHPLGWEDTTAYLKSVALTVSPTKGEFLDEPSEGVRNFPRIWRDQVFFLRNRVAGIASAVDKILDDIDGDPMFPPSLSQITGEAIEWEQSGLVTGNVGSSVISSRDDNDSVTLVERDEILLVSEANDEQIEIVKRLDRSGSVVVQGPPGTGKTHTISNLIGHLLSQGKSILVTAHTAKALRVLRDKVPDMLKPLCVSVLGSDQLARRQLESSISSITERLTSETHESLLRKSQEFQIERRELVNKHLTLKHQLREAIENEYKTIDVGAKQFTPTDAARLIALNKKSDEWIPSPIRVSTNIESKIGHIERVYLLGTVFSKTEENDSRLDVPSLSDLPSETDFGLMVSDYDSLITQDLSYGKEKWLEADRGSEQLAEVLSLVETEFGDELLAQSWRPYAIVSGLHGALEHEVWLALIEKIDLAVESGAKYLLVLQHRPSLSDDVVIHKQLATLAQICAHLEKGGKLSFIQLVAKPEWRQVIKASKVAAGEPIHLDHFNALKQLAELKASRLDLEDLWNSLIGNHINKPFDQLGDTPEQSCRPLIPEIRRCLGWNDKVWSPLAGKLRTEGLKLDDLISAIPRDASHIAEYLVIESFAKAQLIALVQNELARRKLKEIESAFLALKNLVVRSDPSRPDQGCINLLVKAITKKNVSAYEQALTYLRRIISVKPLVIERDSILKEIHDIAPAWSGLISQRISPHDQASPPNDIARAWLWRQLSEILNERHKLNIHDVQKEIERNNVMLREVTRFLVDSLAWGQQLKRLHADNSMRQALLGWLDTAKRLASTRQIDKRQTLLSEARKLMKRCSEAVPVWIMPISIMAESFDPQTTKFDVVIIDEASQADINALIPLYMGKQIIVVGDHEQVTPLGVGKDQTILENLRRSMLKDIPNAHLYDNMSSIYDLARQSFGDGVRLVEHFRCVPNIIGFSNALSYEGKIRPLREASSSLLIPSCVPLRVNGIRDGDINKEEADQIVALIRAMIQHESYSGKTIGIISMLGEAQAVYIQSLIHKKISSIEIENRRIQAGISSEFQGDERDVIFLSMVDSALDTNTLRATGDGAFEQTKKRYNVATSRARDQLWVIHSFDPDLHLKASDLRYRLLQHVRDPDSSLRNYEQQVGRTESPFEVEVLKRLTTAGFKVTAQVEVGYFRIDMVVEGLGKRLAIECDGDRYHPVEQLAADMNRQAILERLGWNFARIRGSAFYRDPDSAMERVFQQLEEMEILPNTVNDASKNQKDTALIDELHTIISNGFVTEALSDENEEGDDLISNNSGNESEEINTSSNSEPSVSQNSAEASKEAGDVSDPDEGSSSNGSFAEVEKSSIKPNAGLIDYPHYSGGACNDPRVSSRDQICDGLLKIISTEGPVQTKRVFDIYLRSCGIKRMGPDLRESLLKSLQLLKRTNLILGHNFKDSDDDLGEIVWLIGRPSELLRKRGDRTLEEIPLNELYAISKLVITIQNIALGSEDHMRAMLEYLDLKRLTTLAESLLKLAISGQFTQIGATNL
jgi:very-short-patch-repair endonuclease